MRSLLACYVIGVIILGAGCGYDEADLERMTRGALEASNLEGEFASQQLAEELETLYSRAKNKRTITNALVNWAAERPERFALLADDFAPDGLAAAFAASATESGRSFLLLERLTGRGDAVQPLLNAIRDTENQDRRAKVPAYRLAPDSPLQRVARLSAEFAGQVWEGGAMLLLESQCQLAFAAAGHTFMRESGGLRAPLENFELRLADKSYRVVDVITSRPALEPEHDWALVIADKDYCGRKMPQDMIGIPMALELPATGLEVTLYCYQQGRADMDLYLYEEQCRVYPSNSGALDLYASKPPNLLGVHSCYSEKGSSGCPLLVSNAGELQFVGVQIERHGLTLAGIARLFSGEFITALAEVRVQFEAADAAYFREHGLHPMP